MGAQVNGHGMVGIWPGVEIVSVRALKGREQAFRYQAYKSGIDECLYRKGRGEPIVVISLSLGGVASPSADDEIKLQASVQRAASEGVSVVAAAGNAPGPVLSPARESGVLGVGAGNAIVDYQQGAPVGALCYGTAGLAPFSSAGRDVVAPGCFLDQTSVLDERQLGWGASQATATVAALLAAMRAYAPVLSRDAAETALTNSSNSAVWGGWISAQRLFASAGIDWRSIELPARTQAPEPATAVVSAAAVARYPRPAVMQRRWVGNRLVIRVRRCTECMVPSLSARALGPASRVLARSSVHHGSQITLRVPLGTRWVDLRYRGGDALDSLPFLWHPRAPAASPRTGRLRGEFR